MHSLGAKVGLSPTATRQPVLGKAGPEPIENPGQIVRGSFAPRCHRDARTDLFIAVTYRYSTRTRDDVDILPLTALRPVNARPDQRCSCNGSEHDVSNQHQERTRRVVLRSGLAAVGGVVAAGAARAASMPQRLAQEKIAQAQVQYQNTPKDAQQCDKCVNWEAPNACKIVAGTIAPQGWCIAFAPKSG